jgi:hypothetical protein
LAEKLTMKALSEELNVLRERLKKLEAGLERKLEQAMERGADKLKTRIEQAEGRPLGLNVRSGPGVDIEARRKLIAETAYLRAEQRGFTGGNPELDWLEAEREVDWMLLHGWSAQPPTPEPDPEPQKSKPARGKRGTRRA